MENECRVVCEETGAVLAERCELALTVWPRMRGLMFRREVPEGVGMLFPHCSSIHTFFMRTSIDVIYMEKEGRVVKIVRSLQPWRFSWCPGARSVLELPAGTVAREGVLVGHTIYTE